MTRPKNFWWLGLLSASCLVKSFTIEDQLPGSAGSSGAGAAGSGAGGAQATNAGTSNQGGDGASGATSQGGKVGTAGSQGEGGALVADAGEPNVGQGGGAEGGAPAGAIAPCDQSEGKPPLLCDDFESGVLNAQKWSPPAGLAVTTAQGAHGLSKMVYLDGDALATKLGDFPLPEAGGEVTVSFWVSVRPASNGAPILTFRDRSAVGQTLRLNVILQELGWRSSGNNYSVPQSPTPAMFPLEVWTCVSIHLTARSIALRYQALGSGTVNTLIIDETSTPGVDANWLMLPADNRYVSGSPAFGGIYQGVAANLYLDDVRIAADSSSICPF